jgi:hypothetical protein
VITEIERSLKGQVKQSIGDLKRKRQCGDISEDIEENRKKNGSQGLYNIIHRYRSQIPSEAGRNSVICRCSECSGLDPPNSSQ